MSKIHVYTADFCSVSFFFQNARNILLIIPFYMQFISVYFTSMRNLKMYKLDIHSSLDYNIYV